MFAEEVVSWLVVPMGAEDVGTGGSSADGGDEEEEGEDGVGTDDGVEAEAAGADTEVEEDVGPDGWRSRAAGWPTGARPACT